MELTSHSQAAQDRFAWEVLGRPLSGTFLDVGCNHPTENSNTAGLEAMGWTGILFDRDAIACELCRKERKATVIEGNAVTFDWKTLPIKEFDYLSLDVDSVSAVTLMAILCAGITFRCATIEHDAYAYPKGESPRPYMRGALFAAGYTLVASDVSATKGMPFEDWYVNATKVPKDYQRFTGLARMGKDIMDRATGVKPPGPAPTPPGERPPPLPIKSQ